MEEQPNDDSFDRFMLFLSRWARPAAKEWFTLLEWMLILSAVAFAVKMSPQPLYQVALYVSFALLWIYLMIGYQALWHDYLSSTTSPAPDAKFSTFLKRYAVWAAGALAANLLAAFMLALAVGFATELVEVLNH
jgi:hypothetical protein